MGILIRAGVWSVSREESSYWFGVCSYRLGDDRQAALAADVAVQVAEVVCKPVVLQGGGRLYTIVPSCTGKMGRTLMEVERGKKLFNRAGRIQRITPRENIYARFSLVSRGVSAGFLASLRKEDKETIGGPGSSVERCAAVGSKKVHVLEAGAHAAIVPK